MTGIEFLVLVTVVMVSFGVGVWYGQRWRKG